MSQQQQQSPQQSSGFSLTDSANLLFTLAHIWALPSELLIRRHFGSRYIDIFLLPAAIWPAIFAVFCFPECPAEWSLWAFWFFLIFGPLQRGMAVRLDRKGVWRHSEYNGDSVLAWFLRKEEATCKGRWEVLLVLAFAFLCCVISPSMGAFFAGSAVALFIKQLFYQQDQEQRIADLRDSYLEQQSLANRFRERP